MAPTLLRGSKPPHLRLLKSSLETRLSAKGLRQRGMWGTPAFLPDTSDAGAWERSNRVLMVPISPRGHLRNLTPRSVFHWPASHGNRRCEAEAMHDTTLTAQRLDAMHRDGFVV